MRLGRMSCGEWVIAYGVYTTHGTSPLCDGVNLNDRGKAACECVCVYIEFDYTYSDSIVCHHCRLHFVRILYMSSLLVVSLSLSVILVLVALSSYPPPPAYTGRPRNVPLPKRAHGWDMMTPPPTSSTNAHLLCDCGTPRHTIH